VVVLCRPIVEPAVEETKPEVKGEDVSDVAAQRSREKATDEEGQCPHTEFTLIMFCISVHLPVHSTVLVVFCIMHFCSLLSYNCHNISCATFTREELHVMSQPQCGRCHQAGTGQATLEVIGSKESYALKCCNPNNEDDDNDDGFYHMRYFGNT